MIEDGASPREPEVPLCRQTDLFERIFGKRITSKGWAFNPPIRFREENNDTDRLDWMLTETDAASWGWDRAKIDEMMKEEKDEHLGD